MCDFFENISNTSTSHIVGATNEVRKTDDAGAFSAMDMPDMDVLLDQLEHQEETLEQQNQQQLDIMILPEPVQLQHEIFEQSLDSITSKVTVSGQHKAQPSLQLIDVFSSPLLDKEQASLEIPAQQQGDEQIDRMDALIRAEEKLEEMVEVIGAKTTTTNEHEKLAFQVTETFPDIENIAENSLKSLKKGIKSEEIISPFIDSDLCQTQQQTCHQLLEHFVDTIVDCLLDQAITESQASSSSKEQSSEKTHKILKSEIPEQLENNTTTMPLDNPKLDEFNTEEPEKRCEMTETTDEQQLQSISALTIVYDLSVALDEFKLTESELMLGKKKPYWIPDLDCPNCMLCSNRFSLVNRRHHCRACGRVLCRSCCCQRRQLAYMDDREGRQRVCTPCNRTLDRIEEYERRIGIGTTPKTLKTKMDESSKISSVDYETGNPSTSSMDNGMESELQTVVTTSPNDLSENQSINSMTTTRKTKSLFKAKRLVDDEHRLLTPIDKSAQPLLLKDVDENEEENEQPQTNNSGANECQHSEKQQLSELQSPQQQRLTSSSSITSNGSNKRSVKFRDGVNPGQEHLPNSPLATVMSAKISPYKWLVSGNSSTQTNFAQNGNNSLSIHQQSEEVSDLSVDATTSNLKQYQIHSHHGKKLPRKVSRRTKERRMMEEEISLLQQDLGHICVVIDSNRGDIRWGTELQPCALGKVVADLFPSIIDNADDLMHTQVTIALRRNFFVHCEWRRKFYINQPYLKHEYIEVVSFITNGLKAIGVDELMLVLQFDRTKFSSQTEIQKEFLFALEEFEHIFLSCLDSFEDSMDHRMGIRKCVDRMARLYHPLAKNKKLLLGHIAGALYFYRPSAQQFFDLICPSGPFLLGAIVFEEELPWTFCVPSRLLLRLGQHTGQYPFPLVNMIRDQPVFTKDAIQSSVLKVLNDFRNWTYRMTKLPGSAIIMRLNNNNTDVCLPKLSLDNVRSLVESNRNMIGWALNELAPVELEMKVDSHLVCEQTAADGQFCTRVFAKDFNDQRKVTGASFVIFDGALKGGEQFLVSVVEDGLVVRLHADLMEELVKALLVGDSFTTTNVHGHHLNVQFVNSNPVTTNQQLGELISPIDGRPLEGQFQYGLQLTRQLHTLNFFQYTSEWALRLATVINMLPGKWPSALQPRFFDVCEQLAQHVANSVEPFLQELVAANQLSISLRVQVDDDAVSYETERWDTLPDQHFVWTVTMDEHIIPFLYSLCAWVPSCFHVELHMPILSIRPLPAMTVLGSPVLPRRK